VSPLLIWNIVKIVGPIIIVAGIYFHYQGLVADREKLKTVEAKMEQLQADIEVEAYARKTADKSFSESRVEREETETVLRSHDLDRLLQAKPNMVINRINTGTNRVFLELERIGNESAVPEPTED
jgi:hypothetical protein